MSKVSRSVYQKVCEENKKLKKQIDLLVSTDPKRAFEGMKLRMSIRAKIRADKEFWDGIREAAKKLYYQQKLKP